MAWREGRDVIQRQPVVAVDRGTPAELLHVTGKVVDERIVVVDQKDHVGIASASIMPRALSSVSRYSCPGSDSATIAPPALKYSRPARATAVRMAMLLSRAPVTLQYPIVPQYTPRAEDSS